MQYQQTPQTLADIWKGPVGAFIPSMNLFDQQGQRDQITQADQTRQLDFNYNADPMRLAQMGLANQTTEAQLPGIAAQSSMQQRKDRMGADTYDQEVKKLMSQYKADEMAGYVKEMQGLGDLAITHSAGAFAEPFGAATRIREAFDKAGHGKFWNPEWDSMPVSMLGDKLKRFGTDIHESSAGYQKALDSIAAKASSAEKIAEWKNATDLEKMKMRAEADKAIAKLKQEAGNDPKKLEEAAVALFTAARVEPDAEKRQQLIMAAQEFMQQKAYLNAASAATTQSGAVDMNAIQSKPGQPGKIEARGPVPVQAPPPVSMGASAPPAAPAAPVSVPSAAHINALKNNPAMAAEFDAKFGPGAAAKYSK
jgi:hypothetical protein